MRWPWQRQDSNPHGEAKEAFQQIAARDKEVKRLSHELREAQRRNHFSEMVIEAMTRRTKEGH